MGLDMYLNKAKKFGNATVEDICTIDSYLSWKNDESSNMYSFEEWCGKKESEVNNDLLMLYEKECIERYYSWDDEKKYGHETIIESITSWRKANQIHQWFVNNVQDGNDDCGTYEVGEEQLLTLLNICKEVLSKSKLVDGMIENGKKFENGKLIPIMQEGKYIEDPSVAIKLLPSQSGFFFGSTKYDEWYLDDVKHTISVLEKVLRDTDFKHEIVMYSSSW